MWYRGSRYPVMIIPHFNCFATLVLIWVLRAVRASKPVVRWGFYITSPSPRILHAIATTWVAISAKRRTGLIAYIWHRSRRSSKSVAY